MRAELIAEQIRIETQRMFEEGTILALKLQLRQNIARELAELTKDLNATNTARHSVSVN